MKSKKRHDSSSDESEDSEVSEKSSSSSGSESESSVSEHRHKKKRKRADYSESDSETDDDQKRKKRKHKKKKKKHSKKKRRTDSFQLSGSAVEISSVSDDGEISSKKRRKHKHKHKRARTSSVSEVEERVEHRLHSVVKERRASSAEGSPPARTYYQREYRRSASRHSGDEYEREREVQRFYRGSSKERKQYLEQYQYNRDRNDKYAPYDKNERQKYEQREHYGNTNEEYNRRPREYDEYKRHQRFEERRPVPEYRDRPREEVFPPREDTRGYNRFHQFEDRDPRRREYEERRDYRERRGAPPEPGHYREREIPDKRERYREEYASERAREDRRERPASRPEKPPPPPPHRERSKSASPEDRYRGRRPEPRVERERSERFRDGRGDEKRDNRDEEKRDGRGEEKRDRPARSQTRTEVDRPPAKIESRSRDRKTRFENEDNKEYSWGKTDVKKEEKPQEEKDKPNFGLSGKLTAEANTVNGVVIKYAEPDDAKQPKRRWRFYPFKGDKAMPILYIHRQSAFLIGRDKKVADIHLEHPSISKQHAALQYRATPFTRPDGSQGRRVRPYIIDLESANGTFVNNKKVDARRYVELLERDVVKFGFSQREYVLLHENSKDDAQDDDNQEPASVTTTDHIKQEKRAQQEVAEDGE